MWEAIERNKRRSWMLLALMGVILLALGYVIGAAVYVEFVAVDHVRGGFHDYGRMLDQIGQAEDPGDGPSFFGWSRNPGILLNAGGLIGAGIAMIVWVALAGVAFFGGDRAILWAAGGHEISRDAAPKVWNVVEEMTIAAGLPKPPRVFLIDDDGMNAFAVGLSPDHAAVAVTAGLVKHMNRDELQGVVAHEIAHIHNYDIRFMTLASIMVGSIVILSETFLRSFRFAAPRRSSGSGKNSGGQAILLIVAVIFAILAPIAAHILYFACSRKREYLADACAARFTRYPPGLASALEKIGRAGPMAIDVSKSLVPLYIANPLQPMSASSVFATHPPLEKRIAILRAMSGAGYVDYENAFRSAMASSKSLLNEEFLRSEASVPVRKSSVEQPPQDEAVERSREAHDVLDRAANYLFVPCACGVRLKLPPGMDREAVSCPRCGRRNVVPHAISPSVGQTAEASTESTYQRTTTGWESFRCVCGKTIQLSPSFAAARASCRSCGRHVRILGGNSE